MVDVVDVSVLAGFRVRLRFDDGAEREVDLAPFLKGPVFEPLLRDRRVFESVRADPELGTIVWPTGADVDPDVLYEAGVAIAVREEHRQRDDDRR